MYLDSCSSICRYFDIVKEKLIPDTTNNGNKNLGFFELLNSFPKAKTRKIAIFIHPIMTKFYKKIKEKKLVIAYLTGVATIFRHEAYI